MRENNQNRTGRLPSEEFGTVVVGRNPVMELLKSGREIEKLYVQRGEREGSITKIFAEARKRSIVISEVDKKRLDELGARQCASGCCRSRFGGELCLRFRYCFCRAG